jgi:hypothetical protein
MRRVFTAVLGIACLFVGFVTGALLVLTLSQTASKQFVMQETELFRAVASTSGLASIEKQDLPSAEHFLGVEYGVLDFQKALSSKETGWAFEYPISLILFWNFDAQSTFANGRSFTREQAWVVGKIAYIKEQRGNADEASRMFREAANTLGRAPDDVRRQVIEAVNEKNNGHR